MCIRPCVIVGVICGSWMVERGYMTMVLIDMEKPKDCIYCPILESGGDCMLIEDCSRYTTYEEQYRDCPLKEVQT